MVVEVDVGKVLVVEWEKYEATAVSGLLLLWKIGLGHLFLGKFFMDVNIPLLKLAFVVYFLALA